MGVDRLWVERWGGGGGWVTALCRISALDKTEVTWGVITGCSEATLQTGVFFLPEIFACARKALGETPFGTVTITMVSRSFN